MDVQLVFSPVWSWLVVIATAGGLYGIVLWTYPPRIQSLHPGRRRILLGLRLFAATLIVFLLFRPSLEFSQIDERGAQIVLLCDQSRSMNTPDGPGGTTRRQHLLKTMEDIAPALEALRKKVDLRFIEFSETTKEVEKLEPLSDGRFTAIGMPIEELRKETQSKRLATVFLLSDGAQRATGEAAVDPQSAARRFAMQKSVPIHTVLFGTPEISTTGLDLAVEDLLLNSNTYERKIEVVKARLRMVGAAGRKVRVKLQIEDRTGKRLGESGAWKDAPFSPETKTSLDLETTENATVIPVSLSFVAEQPGEYKVALVVEPLPGEVKTTNNRLETLISVSKGGMRVAYFDVLRPEQKFIRKVNDSTRIQLDWFIVRSGASGRPIQNAPQEFHAARDAKLFAPGKYDVYLLGDVPASAFRLKDGNLLNDLADRVNEGAGLCLLGGQHNYSRGGYGSTRLGQLAFPVKLSAKSQPQVGVDLAQQWVKKIEIRPTEAGIGHYLMVLDPNQNEQLWRKLPPMTGANRLVPLNPAVEVLAESSDGDPVILATDVGRSRVAALAIDETYLWHLSGFSDAHQRFWQQLFLWLAHKDQDGDQLLSVRIDPRNFSPGGKVPIRMELRDKNRQPVPDAEYSLEIIGPEGSKLTTPVPQKQKSGAFSEFAQTATPGDYWVTARATLGGKAQDLPAMTRFIVEARDPELDNPAADPDLMAEIATLTGASSIPPEKLREFLDDLLKSGISTELTRNRSLPLWDNWPILLLLTTVMTLEWFLRKRSGLV